MSRRESLTCAIMVIILINLSCTIQVSCQDIGTMSMEEVVINEVLYDPIGNDVDGEFMEIFNNGASSVDVTGWQITDNDGDGPDMVLPAMTLPSKAFIVVWSGGGVDDLDPSDGVISLHMGRSQGVWTNTGDDVLLLREDGTPADLITFGEGTYVDPTPVGTGWNGSIGLFPEGYSLSRLPDGQDTDHASDLDMTLATPGLVNSHDSPPELTDFGIGPNDPAAFEDLQVWTQASDDVMLERVWTEISEGGGTPSGLEMSYRNGRYETTIPGRPSGTTLMIVILAMDTGGRVNMTKGSNVSFWTNVTPELELDMTIPTGPVEPGDTVLIKGEAVWSNGSSANGTIHVEIPRTAGSWSSNFSRYPSQMIEVPLLEGEYPVRITVMANGQEVILSGDIIVRWPHERLDVVVEMPMLADETELMVRGNFTVLGRATWEDGLPVSKAPAVIEIEGTATRIETVLETDGTFMMDMVAPSISGTYRLKVTVETKGRRGEASLEVEVRDGLRLSITEWPGETWTSDNFTVKGKVKHHDRSPASNTLVIVEVLDTPIKERTYSDENGDFEVVAPSPSISGNYEIRITAVSGNSTNDDMFRIEVKGEEKPSTPGWSAAVLALSLMIVVLVSRRMRPR